MLRPEPAKKQKALTKLNKQELTKHLQNTTE